MGKVGEDGIYGVVAGPDLVLPRVAITSAGKHWESIGFGTSAREKL